MKIYRLLTLVELLNTEIESLNELDKIDMISDLEQYINHLLDVLDNSEDLVDEPHIVKELSLNQDLLNILLSK